jgi:hypothetical protein
MKYQILLILCLGFTLCHVAFARVAEAIDIHKYPYACVGVAKVAENVTNFNIVTLSDDLKSGYYIDIESKTTVPLKAIYDLGTLRGTARHVGLYDLEATITADVDSDSHPIASTTELKVDGESLIAEPGDRAKFFAVPCKKYTQQQILKIYLGR